MGDVGKMWGGYGEDMGRMWGGCGEDMGIMVEIGYESSGGYGVRE